MNNPFVTFVTVRVRSVKTISLSEQCYHKLIMQRETPETGWTSNAYCSPKSWSFGVARGKTQKVTTALTLNLPPNVVQFPSFELHAERRSICRTRIADWMGSGYTQSNETLKELSTTYAAARRWTNHRLRLGHTRATVYWFFPADRRTAAEAGHVATVEEFLLLCSGIASNTLLKFYQLFLSCQFF